MKSIQKDGPRSGRKPSQKVVKRILEATTQEKPPGATHLSGRTLANHLGVGRSVVHRVWRQHSLQLHRAKIFKLSYDPKFEEKLLRAEFLS
ncbi:MAG: hypothetical protein JNL58_21375 [Planctomyces sp.]|nr:hypothetical protein [Planctomyces sp.]